MKLLMLTPYFPPHVGGVEQHVLRVSQELAARGHFVRVLTLRHAPDLPRHKEMGPLEVFRTPRSRLARAVGLRLRLLREADIVHCHDAYAFRRFVGPMRLLSGRPIFITFHGYEGYPIAAGAIRLRQAIAGKVRGSICMGEFICRHYHTRCDHISYGGVDMPDPPAPPPSPSGGAVFIGRLEPDTAIETYLEALRIARDEHGVRLDLEVCGDGSLRPALERYAAEHALSVLFRGAVADVRPALTRASRSAQ